MCAPTGGPPRIGPALLSLPGGPLEYFAAEHMRQRKVFSALEHLAATGIRDRTLASEISAFLRNDLTLHVRDQDEDLFRLMRRRCAPEDEIDRALSTLAEDNAG